MCRLCLKKNLRKRWDLIPAALKHLQSCQASVVEFHPSACVECQPRAKSLLPVCVHLRNSDDHIIVYVQQFTLFVYTTVHPFIKVINNNFLCIFHLSHSENTADLYYVTDCVVGLDPWPSEVIYILEVVCRPVYTLDRLLRFFCQKCLDQHLCNVLKLIIVSSKELTM